MNMNLSEVQIAEIISYGIEWYKFDEQTKEQGQIDYNGGAAETTAHIGACLICQNLMPDESVDTQDVYAMIEDNPDVDTLTIRIYRYVRNIEGWKA